jgi:hypothetical protein
VAFSPQAKYTDRKKLFPTMTNNMMVVEQISEVGATLTLYKLEG